MPFCGFGVCGIDPTDCITVDRVVSYRRVCTNPSALFGLFHSGIVI
jgi:hypothetical protein